MGAELPLCIVVIVVTTCISENAVICFLESSVRSFCFISRITNKLCEYVCYACLYLGNSVQKRIVFQKDILTWCTAPFR